MKSKAVQLIAAANFNLGNLYAFWDEDLLGGVSTFLVPVSV
jgi:hypothetical protein